MPSTIRGSDNFESDDVIGLGQTWQDVTGSRVSGTVYTNTTGKPIQLAISLTLTASVNTTFEISGAPMINIGGSGASATMTPSIYPIIPAGATYRLVTAAGMSIVRWAELR
jgi:hypothetical protein